MFSIYRNTNYKSSSIRQVKCTVHLKKKLGDESKFIEVWYIFISNI